MRLRYNNESKLHRFGRYVLISAVSLLVLLYVWWILSIILGTAAIPAPPRVWDAFTHLLNEGDVVTGYSMWDHIFASLKRFAIAFVIAFAVAVPVGLLIGYSKTLDDFTRPILEVLRPIAPIAWAPVLVFAIDRVWGPILVVFIGIFFPLLTNTVFGVKKIEPNLLDASKTLGANKTQTFYKVMFPCTVPYIMNGVKIGLGIGWMCIIAAEMVAPYGGGLGYFISMHAFNGSWPFVFVGIILISILGLLTIGLAERAHKIIAKRTGME
ncbi:MAG: ABC transporter permease [Methanomassiliicoccaceae archaeon]|jgi:NitT/TauT family transport system permease protein|nr:ABC transporter permease [Methanomassiliicoccaceae archaeon]